MGEDAEDMIEVEITARQRVYYRQRKLVPASSWALYNQMIEKNEGQFGDQHFNEMFEWLIDPEDVSDSDEIEGLEMELPDHDPDEAA